MAVTDITPVELSRDTASADLPDATATSVATGADGFKIAAADIGRNRNVVIEMVDTGSSCTVTFNAGDNPPAMRAGLGNLEVTMAASDVKFICLEQARFAQDDGTIQGIVSGNALVRLRVLVLPVDV